MTDYRLLAEQALGFAEGCTWDITLYANISALTACMRIPVGKGVCGTAVKEDRVLRVDDVHLFKGHIACDSASNSEIVLPIHLDGRIIGVLDIDSPVRSRFSVKDEEGLRKITGVIEECLKNGLKNRE